MIDFSNIRLLVFDADDTLWDCQSHFETVMKKSTDILSKYADRADVERQLYQTERNNMPLMGFGTKAFTISLVENALKSSHFRVAADEVLEILTLGKELLMLPATPLDGVQQTLNSLKQSCKYRMLMFTKGESLDQKGKITRSSLSEYFDDIIIVDDKTNDEYLKICKENSVEPIEMLMIGNSFRSDIAPALHIGANAIHIPFHVTWALEHAETYEHERLITLSSIKELTQYLL